MRSVSLTIQGEYWDSQIYSGELMLFDCDGAVHRIDWRQVIDALATQHSSFQTAVRVAFSDSDLFYNPKVRKILCDPHIETPIKVQLATLAQVNLVASHAQWRSYWRTEETPFDFLPTDTDVYYNRIFAGGDEGLFSAPRGSLSTARLFRKHATKHHDGRIFQVRASDRYTAVAAAGGDDGLFEFAFSRNDGDILKEQRRLAYRPCSACDWAFQSVMGWTVENAFLANFKQEHDPRTNKPVRSFDRIVETREIFGDLNGASPKGGFTWGSREKIYRFSEQGVEVTNYVPAKPKGKPKAGTTPPQGLFSQRGSAYIHFDATAPIATGTAPFGTILEFDDRLVVLRSDGETEVYPGEPVHWRVFPRSEHYSNQLHIIYEDRLLVISFVHDYFVNQSSKLYGFARGGSDKNIDDE